MPDSGKPNNKDMALEDQTIADLENKGHRGFHPIRRKNTTPPYFQY